MRPRTRNSIPGRRNRGYSFFPPLGCEDCLPPTRGADVTNGEVAFNLLSINIHNCQSINEVQSEFCASSNRCVADRCVMLNTLQRLSKLRQCRTLPLVNAEELCFLRSPYANTLPPRPSRPLQPTTFRPLFLILLMVFIDSLVQAFVLLMHCA
jgi:hypothetical protein